MCGSDTIANYVLDIFKRANVQLNNQILTILVLISLILGYSISACIMSHVKRKIHIACSAAFMAISQGTLGFALKAAVCMIYILYFHAYKVSIIKNLATIFDPIYVVVVLYM